MYLKLEAHFGFNVDCRYRIRIPFCIVTLSSANLDIVREILISRQSSLVFGPIRVSSLHSPLSPHASGPIRVSSLRCLLMPLVHPHEKPEDWCLRKLQALEPKHFDSCLRNFKALCGDGRKLRWATVCAGSECPTLWFMGFCRAMRSIALDVPIDHPRASPHDVITHVFSCEIVPAKQAFICKHFLPCSLFVDLTTLGHDNSWDVLSASLQPVPGQGLDMLQDDGPR